MPQINILNILQGDNQTTIVDKVNYNFDQILSAGGGPQGLPRAPNLDPRRVRVTGRAFELGPSAGRESERLSGGAVHGRGLRYPP